MLDIYIDADGCPVKDEIYKVAARCSLRVFVVSNSFLNVPLDVRIQPVRVGSDLDAADDWIAEHIDKGDIAITADIPLASRCLQRGAEVLDPRGRPFTEDNIGDALATRELKDTLRQMGIDGGGPPPMDKKHRSRFLSALDTVVQRVKREG